MGRVLASEYNGSFSGRPYRLETHKGQGPEPQWWNKYPKDQRRTPESGVERLITNYTKQGLFGRDHQAKKMKE